MATAKIPRLNKVLVSTDGSALGNRAVAHAFGAVADGGTVTIAHVLEADPVPNPLYAHYSTHQVLSDDEKAARRTAVEAQLRKLVPAAAAERGVRAEVRILEADDEDTAAALCDLADDLKVDLICLGSHGHKGWMSLLAGSVAQAVLGQSRRPVLVVPPAH